MATKRPAIDRDKLIRAHFDAYSELIWAQDLEPKFTQYNVDAAEMKEYRQAWNQHTEARDWEWWLGKVEAMSNGELQQEIAECKAETDAIRKKASSPGAAELSAALFSGQSDTHTPSPQIPNDGPEHERGGPTR